MEFKKILVPVDGSETAEKLSKSVLIWQSSTMRNSSFST